MKSSTAQIGEISRLPPTTTAITTGEIATVNDNFGIKSRCIPVTQAKALAAVLMHRDLFVADENGMYSTPTHKCAERVCEVGGWVGQDFCAFDVFKKTLTLISMTHEQLQVASTI